MRRRRGETSKSHNNGLEERERENCRDQAAAANTF